MGPSQPASGCRRSSSGPVTVNKQQLFKSFQLMPLWQPFIYRGDGRDCLVQLSCLLAVPSKCFAFIRRVLCGFGPAFLPKAEFGLRLQTALPSRTQHLRPARQAQPRLGPPLSPPPPGSLRSQSASSSNAWNSFWPFSLLSSLAECCHPLPVPFICSATLVSLQVIGVGTAA